MEKALLVLCLIQLAQLVINVTIINRQADEIQELKKQLGVEE